MLIEVYSDTVCPWCFVGLARLQQALRERPDRPVELAWLPFELNPEIAPEGEDRAEYLKRRFGDVNRFAAAQGTLQDVGAELGLSFDFAGIRRMPNTRRSHMLIEFAARSGRQTEVKRRILTAYFSEGRDIGDPDVLLQIAAEAGLDAGAARSALGDVVLHDRIEALEQQARRWNINGVPTFVFGRRFAFSGAQPLSVFLQALDDAAKAPASGAVAGA